MSRFSPSEAAFEGFRLAREKPGLISSLAVFQLIVNVIAVALLFLVLGPHLKALKAWFEALSTQPTPNLSPDILDTILRLYAIIIPIALLSQSMVLCAVYRAILRPSDKGLGYVKLSADELRMMALMIAFMVLFTIVYIVAVLLSAIVFGILGAILGAMTHQGESGAVGGALIGYIVALLAMIWVGVRLSLAAPMTFSERKIRILESWKVTKGQFWSLLGAYALSLLMALVVWIIGMIIISAVAAILGGGLGALAQTARTDWASFMDQPNWEFFAAFAKPAIIARAVLGVVISALTVAIFLAPAAVAYRELTGGAR